LLQETSPGHKLHCKFGNLTISADKAVPLEDGVGLCSPSTQKFGPYKPLAVLILPVVGVEPLKIATHCFVPPGMRADPHPSGS
jgi:hypothetical protein